MDESKKLLIALECSVDAVSWQALAEGTTVRTLSMSMYGLKSPAAHLLFLDDVNREAVMELDVGYYVTYTADAITLVKPKPNVTFPNGTTGKFRLLSSYRKMTLPETYGTFRWV